LGEGIASTGALYRKAKKERGKSTLEKEGAMSGEKKIASR